MLFDDWTVSFSSQQYIHLPFFKQILPPRREGSYVAYATTTVRLKPWCSTNMRLSALSTIQSLGNTFCLTSCVACCCCCRYGFNFECDQVCPSPRVALKHRDRYGAVSGCFEFYTQHYYLGSRTKRVSRSEDNILDVRLFCPRRRKLLGCTICLSQHRKPELQWLCTVQVRVRFRIKIIFMDCRPIDYFFR